MQLTILRDYIDRKIAHIMNILSYDGAKFFHNIREIVKELSEKTDFVEFSDKKSNQEITRSIHDLIQKRIYGEIYKI